MKKADPVHAGVHAQESAINSNPVIPWQTKENGGGSLVAGAGFEPVTFGL